MDVFNCLGQNLKDAVPAIFNRYMYSVLSFTYQCQVLLDKALKTEVPCSSRHWLDKESSQLRP